MLGFVVIQMSSPHSVWEASIEPRMAIFRTQNCRCALACCYLASYGAAAVEDAPGWLTVGHGAQPCSRTIGQMPMACMTMDGFM